MNKGNKRSWIAPLFFVFLLQLLTSTALAISPEPLPETNTCSENLNLCIADRIRISDDYNVLEAELENMTADRDRYKALYEETLIQNFSVAEINQLQEYVWNTYQFYNLTYQDIQEIHQDIRNITIINITIAVIFTLSLIGALWKFSAINAKIKSTFTSIKQEMKSLSVTSYETHERRDAKEPQHRR